ncbi:MAG TPA: LLM class flavin-dependent oxidoreductase [Candidatus Limnocylindrales bacterium]|nr:LLM class flavin-dependent oxidoreductase [Candidatus Limnocylindrales bacterium]
MPPPDTARSKPMTLGLNLPYVEGSMDGATPRWADILAMARTAETIGLDAVWVSDHLGFGDPDGEWHGAWESWTLLSALAASTSRARLGTYVTAAPLRNPALLAKMAETLDEVSGGRVVLGLGAGWNEPEYRAFGVAFDHRFDRFEDALRIITSLLRTGRADYDGPYAQARGARLEPRGPRPSGLPVMVGAAGPRMLRLAAELADEWNAGMRTPDELRPLVAAVDEACAAVGREPATLTRSAEVLVRTVADDAPGPAGAAGARPPGERELRGTPEAIAAALRRYADLGMSHLQVQLRPDTPAAVEALAPVVQLLAGS